MINRLIILVEVIKMSKKDKKNNANKLESSNNNAVECKNHGHDANLASDCGKENCSCTKHDNRGTLTDGE